MRAYVCARVCVHADVRRARDCMSACARKLRKYINNAYNMRIVILLEESISDAAVVEQS